MLKKIANSISKNLEVETTPRELKRMFFSSLIIVLVGYTIFYYSFVLLRYVDKYVNG